MAVDKRIPNGTKVRWQTRYTTDPVHDGVVIGYDVFSAGVPAVYVVFVKANRPSRSTMYPLAVNLEAQNPGKLKRVK